MPCFTRELGSRTDGSCERLLLQEICTFDSGEGAKASGAEQARKCSCSCSKWLLS
jgi:hypothetical protein